MCKKYFISIIIVFLYISSGNSKTVTDRMYWCETMYRIAAPILEPMSEGCLQQKMDLELSPTWDGRDKRVAYMEAFGRTMSGLAPWLSLPDTNTKEGQMRKKLHKWALESYVHAVDPRSPNYLLWRKEGQPLVDAAFIAQSFLRAYDALWVPLDSVTKKRYIDEFTRLRRIDPPYSNWLLFSATVETFLLKAGASADIYRIHSAMRKIDEWYVGDGIYSDGPHFAFDYYNAYVIQPMFLDCILTLKSCGRSSLAISYEKALKRIQRYAVILERMISPEGTFPVYGRSIPYRMAAFQPLAQLALLHQLPSSLPEGQVRSGLTCVMKRMFGDSRNFNKKGFLTLGFNGHQPNTSDYYTSNGSLYMTSLVFLPLGLPETDTFWASPLQDWTQKRAWNGEDFPKDHTYME